jgi:uncharacterized membrane protein YfbV (UPF0208 family)
MKFLLTILAVVLALPVAVAVGIALGPAILVALFIAGFALMWAGLVWLMENAKAHHARHARLSHPHT